MVQGRFSKGKSGNPKGRPRAPKKTETGSAFDIIIDKTLTLTYGGQPREVTVEEALQHRTYLDSIAGSASARRQLLKMILKRERFLASHRRPAPKTIEQRIESDPRNVDQAMQILGIACQDLTRQGPSFQGEQLLLAPWAVQAALSRRRGGTHLTEEQESEIERCTLDPEKLRWSRGARA